MKAIIFDWTGTLYERHKGLFEFTKEVLEKLKPNYKLGLVSKATKNPKERKEKIDASGIKDYFESIFVVSQKSPVEFKKCIDELGVEANETIIVGDRASRDIGPGNKLGCRTIWIRKGDRSYDKPDEKTGKPYAEIDSIKELMEVI